MEYILIGKMIKPFGLKGEMATEVYTDFIKERFLQIFRRIISDTAKIM